jgi:large subunit ribosomal protein L15
MENEMKLNQIKPNAGAVKKGKRVGRGIGSGKGKTCGVGVKGQKARSGVAIGGFEGGQMPLYMRMPKRGFNNIFAINYAELTLGRLQEALDKKLIDSKGAIDEDTLVKARIVSRKKDGIKLLAKGELKSKVDLKLSAATKGAQEAVAKAGGKLELNPVKKASADESKDDAKAKGKKKAKKQSDQSE